MRSGLRMPNAANTGDIVQYSMRQSEDLEPKPNEPATPFACWRWFVSPLLPLLGSFPVWPQSRRGASCAVPASRTAAGGSSVPVHVGAAGSTVLACPGPSGPWIFLAGPGRVHCPSLRHSVAASSVSRGPPFAHAGCQWPATEWPATEWPGSWPARDEAPPSSSSGMGSRPGRSDPPSKISGCSLAPALTQWQAPKSSPSRVEGSEGGVTVVGWDPQGHGHLGGTLAKWDCRV
jgi:hypothetical protein